MRSMTGYGRGEYTENDRKFITEIKSVNHRYNDINVKTPRAMLFFEDKVKKLVSAQVFRGKTDVYIHFETYAKDDIQFSLNEGLADAYVAALQIVCGRYKLTGDIPLELVARYPDVMKLEKTVGSDETDGAFSQTLVQSVQMALTQFIAMREAEGAAIAADLRAKLQNVARLADEIARYAPFVVEEYRQKLTERLKEIYEGDTGEARIMTEIAIFADKSCIDEEMTRLRSHIEQFKTILNETEPVGRKLDFLVQEMMRETNTIASKSNHLEITNSSVRLKNEIEKIREQIQNIE